MPFSETSVALWLTGRCHAQTFWVDLPSRVLHDSAYSPTKRLRVVPSVLHFFGEVGGLEAVCAVEHVLLVAIESLEIAEQFPLIALQRSREVPGFVL